MEQKCVQYGNKDETNCKKTSVFSYTSVNES